MNQLNTIESLQPCSKQYSFKTDLKLNAWFFVAATVWILGRYLLRTHVEWSPATKIATALAPLIPGLLYVRTCLRFVRGLDELQRRIQLEAWLFAALGTLMVEIVINIVTANISAPILSGMSGFGGVAVLMLTLWLIGSAIANCRYN